MLIATLSPHVSFQSMVVAHPSVEALRFNTINTTGGRTKEQVLLDLVGLCGDKPLWLDLKTRQLRITKWGDPGFTTVDLSHRISVNLPTTIYFKDTQSQVVEIVDGSRLILEDAPDRPVGAGEPVNILDPSLVVEGFLTADDWEYMALASAMGQHNYMLSFVEQTSDIAEVLSFDPEANIVAKIESRRGLEFARNEATCLASVRLMAARDDLYTNMGREKIDILAAEQDIIAVDPDAIVASRILTSLDRAGEVTMNDLSDLHMLHMMGYRHFMLSDELCRNRHAFGEAAETFRRYTAQYGG